jgi:hypothetical protein
MKDRVSTSFLKSGGPPAIYWIARVPGGGRRAPEHDGAFRAEERVPSLKLLEIFDQRPALVIAEVFAEIVPGVAVAGLGSGADHELAVLER